MIFRWWKLLYHNTDSTLRAKKPVPNLPPRHKPNHRNCFGIPNMFQRLRFVTRATSTPVFPSTLNRQR